MVVVATALLTGTAAAASPAPAPVTTRSVSFTGSGGLTLHGTVFAPSNSPAEAPRRPGLVMVGGSTSAAHATPASTALRPEAESYARRGVVTLVYDKRTVGYSTFHHDYVQLGDDALAALRALDRQPGVDPARSGLWGLSEGAWAVSLAAAKSQDVRFVVTIGAAGLPPARQTGWADEQLFRHAGVSGSMPGAVTRALRLVSSAGLFPAADYDPLPAWRRLRQPVLLLWGDRDRQAVPAESTRLISAALAQGGNRQVTVRFLPGNHDLHIPTDDGFPHTPTQIPGAADLVAGWINDPAHTPPAGLGTSSPAPHQLTASRPLAPINVGLQIAAATALLAAFASYPATAAARRLMGRRAAPAVRAPARLLAATGLAGTGLSLLYLLFLVADTGGYTLGPLLGGRTLPWLGLQVLAATTVAATVATTALWWRRRDGAGAVRLAILLAGGLLFIPWALSWGLLLP